MPHDPTTTTTDAERLRAQAAALDSNAEQLIAQARELREGAIELRLEAERMERAPLAMLNGNGNGRATGAGTDADFMGHVCELLAGSGRLSSGDIADHLNATPTRVRAALARLEAIGMVRKFGLKRGTRYELTPDTEEAENADTPPKAFGQDYATVVRDVAIGLGTFDFVTIQRELPDLAEPTIRRWLRHWEDKGVLETVRDGNRKLYAHVKPITVVHQARRKEAPPEVLAQRMSGIKMPERGGIPVAGTGRVRTGNKRSQANVDFALRHNAKVRIKANNHVEVEYQGQKVGLALTPSEGSARSDRDKLRKLFAAEGVAV